jgi:NAD(P)-dependent dehydrogenase (short-subunit alcohol dehydrogenase family)
LADQKVAVVTGATSGIGQYIALGVARAGYHTILLARDAGRAETTRAWIAGQARGAVTETVTADLASLAQTRTAGAAIATAHPRIDLLVNNAGLITAQREVTDEGHERILAVNHLAPFVLTQMLQQALRDAGESRVVNVGSRAHERAKMDVDNLELTTQWNPIRAYNRSKLAITMATFEWARRLPGVAVNVVHPGVVRTKLAALPGPIGLGWRLLQPFMIGVEEGADTPLHVALSPQLAGETGQYYKKRLAVRPNPQALDRALTARLWTETTRLSTG